MAVMRRMTPRRPGLLWNWLGPKLRRTLLVDGQTGLPMFAGANPLDCRIWEIHDTYPRDIAIDLQCHRPLLGIAQLVPAPVLNRASSGCLATPWRHALTQVE